MKAKLLVLVLLCAILSGCSGSGYVHITPHSEKTVELSADTITVESYAELIEELRVLVSAGRESCVINSTTLDSRTLEQNMAVASRYIREQDAIGSYVLDSLEYEVGTTGGKNAVAVTAAYRQSAMEIRRILYVDNTAQAEEAISQALQNCRPNVVMLIANYIGLDAAQYVQDYARKNPDIVMELPEVTEGLYGTGGSRVLALSFTYENSRDSLRQMQTQVRPVFEAARLYVSGSGQENQKLSQLYAFLMERFEYTVETSITPTYSLLMHGVGDSRAFATVYAAMCGKAGMECYTVTGARYGEPRTWNIVKDGESYYHVDLLVCNEQGGFWEMTDEQMAGYVWDYSAYPACE